MVRRWLRRKEARPSEILAAALALFVEKGFAATKVEDIARRAGVTKGTPYLYFANKQEIFKAVVRESLLPGLEEGEAVLAADQGSAFEQLTVMLHGWWAHVGANERVSGIPKLVMSEAGNFPELAQFYHDEVVARARGLILTVVQRGMARGEFRPLDPLQLTRLVIAPVMMLMIWQHSLGLCEAEPVDAQGYLATLIEMLRHGVLLPLPVEGEVDA
jgi:AcrR family transcriptional regulator